MNNIKGGSQPKAPNYVDVAREQGQQNLNAVRTGAALNRVNQTNQYGSTTYSQDPNNPDSYTQTTTLSPEQQQIFDQSQQTQYDQGGAAAGRLQQVSGQGAFNYDGLPDRVNDVQGTDFKTDINAPSIGQRNVDLSGISKLPGTDDYSADRQRVEDATYDRSSKRLDQQFGRADEDTRTQLLNQGLIEGSEGWNRAMQDEGNQKMDAYGDARDRAIQAGGAEQSRMFADALAARQQGVGEQFDTGKFANDANAQEFQNDATRNTLSNQAQNDRFAQSLSRANLTNQSRDAGAQERLTERQVPLNEFMQLYSGQPSSQTPGGSVPSAATPQAGNFQDAASSTYGAQADAYNASQARNSQNVNSLIQLASLFYGNK